MKMNGNTKQNIALGGHSMTDMLCDGDSEPDTSNSSLHSRVESVPASPLSDSLLEKKARELSKELDDIFDNLDNFSPSGDGGNGGDDESNVFANLSNLTKDPGKESGPHPSACDRGAQTTESAAVTISASNKVSNTKSNANENSSIGEANSLEPASIIATPTSTMPIRHNSSISRRRHRHIRQMERISESGNDISKANAEEVKVNREFDDVRESVEDVFVPGIVSEHASLNNSVKRCNNGNDDLNIQSSDSHEAALATTLPLISNPRRRVRSLGRSAGSDGGGISIGSGRSRGSESRLRHGRRRLGRSACSADGDLRKSADRIPRMDSSGNTLVASLDAGMATLRRWIRLRRLSFGSGASDACAGGSTSGGHSVPSMTASRLGGDDIFALSHTGSDPLRATSVAASSATIDPTMNVFDPNNNNGFLYYRPYEVHVRNDGDAVSAFYGSDDESGTSGSILLHPFVPSTESSSVDGDGSHQQSRQRARSEPDRARILDFFSSVYGSRAIDGGHTQSGDVAPGSDSGRMAPQQLQQPPHRSSSVRPSMQTSPIIIEEEMEGDQFLTPNDVQSSRLQSLSLLDGDRQSHAQDIEAPDAADLALPPLSGRSATEVGPVGVLESVDGTPNTSIPSTFDPNFHARARWMRINRRFRCIVTSVAVLFSLLLFFIVIAWVLLISTYVLSHNKECDMPLKAYFWMVSLQLMLDIFRADIMKWLCRYRTDSGRRTPPRIVIYNVAYLIYAMLVLRLGVRSVFITESSCSSTAPELFYASLVFVCLSLMAWAMILLGYLVPFCFVAVLLTRNGYFPNGDITSSHGVMGGRRARIGTGRISGIVSEVFPNTCSNPAPPGCVDRLRVVLLHEFPDSYSKQCCICMVEYKEGEVIVATPCHHVFHKRCCQEWLQLSRTCPVCRKDLPNALGMNEGEVQDSAGGSIISLSEEEIRGQNDGTRENRDGRLQGVSNLARFLRRGELSQSSHDTMNDRPEGIAVVEFLETAIEQVHQQQQQF